MSFLRRIKFWSLIGGFRSTGRSLGVSSGFWLVGFCPRSLGSNDWSGVLWRWVVVEKWVLYFHLISGGKSRAFVHSVVTLPFLALEITLINTEINIEINTEINTEINIEINIEIIIEINTEIIIEINTEINIEINTEINIKINIEINIIMDYAYTMVTSGSLSSPALALPPAPPFVPLPNPIIWFFWCW